MGKRSRRNAQTRRPAHHRLTLEQLEARQLMAADLVVDWNNATIDAIRTDPGSANPGDGSRVFALVHTAVYDAVNAITKQYTPFALTKEAPDWASKEAAVATAARDVLAGLYPLQVAEFNALWQQNLAAIPDGAAEDAGVEIGRDAASTILTLRANDGSDGGSDYVVTDAPGHWDVDPLHPDQVVWGPNWGAVSPMVMRHASDFGAPPPPSLDSPEYAAAYNEVKSLGALNSTTRTAEQTEIGLFWAYDRAVMGPPTVMFNQNVQHVAEAKGNSLEDNARLFAMVNVAMADAGVATWKVKFDYDFWRPIQGIREGDTDGNPQTVADPNWVPLGAPGTDPNSTTDDFTPPFPAYTSGHAAFGAATFRTLAHFYGSDSFNFELTSDELPGVTRSYSSFSQAAEENGRSRIYLGVHWNFDDTFSQTIGNEIADYVTEHMFQERDNSVQVMLQRHDAGYKTLSLPAGTPIDMFASGNVLTIVNHASGEVLYEEPMSEVAAVRIDQRNEATDFVRLYVETGTAMPPSMVIEVVGDESWFDGAGLTTGDGNDVIVLNGDLLFAVGATPLLHLYGIGYVDIGTHGGDDVLAVHGDQHGRQVDLAGYEGGDWYELCGYGAELYVSDTVGNDFLNFTAAPSSVILDLALNNGQLQPAAGGNSLRFWGDIEHVKGSQHVDVLLGTTGGNYMDGMGGNDIIHGGYGADYLLGSDGDDLILAGPDNDLIYGNLGNDILQGNGGQDNIYGGEGRDFVIGGPGADLLYGESGDDMLIGGTTTWDANVGALYAILGEWASDKPRIVRQTNIQNGALRMGPGGTVMNDQAVDSYWKGADDAWVFKEWNDLVKG